MTFQEAKILIKKTKWAEQEARKHRDFVLAQYYKSARRKIIEKLKAWMERIKYELP